MMWDQYGWGMGFGMISMVLFWIVIILGIVILVRWVSGGSAASGAPPAKTALDILKERYARGEIDKREFDEKKRDLAN